MGRGQSPSNQQIPTEPVQRRYQARSWALTSEPHDFRIRSNREAAERLGVEVPESRVTTGEEDNSSLLSLQAEDLIDRVRAGLRRYERAFVISHVDRGAGLLYGNPASDAREFAAAMKKPFVTLDASSSGNRRVELRRRGEVSHMSVEVPLSEHDLSLLKQATHEPALIFFDTGGDLEMSQAIVSVLDHHGDLSCGGDPIELNPEAVIMT